MRLSSFLAPAFLALAASQSAEAARNPKNSVLLSNVKSLTLRNGQKTSARRVSPIPQLTCIGGDAKGLYEVDVMRCKNAGSDYDDENIQWTCQASLPEEFKLGSTDVICEGYDSPDDPYILKGSCGVEYRLMLTSQGLEKYGNRKGSWGSGGGSSEGDQETKDGGLGFGPAHWEVLPLVIMRVAAAIEVTRLVEARTLITVPKHYKAREYGLWRHKAKITQPGTAKFKWKS
ncbi:putative transmembrane protein 66 precursor [Diplodia seriata]|uniref:Store-operated calcium entry-associated regulatory factor n=1 Tax=Diplodia seriata TaxID=420778 RepID=A0A0G2EDN8_9PEZI|nr:putative transmembrane protein 66 precursor [Diplodia seriata]